MPFLIERTRSDSFHACTVDDVATILNLLPKRHINTYKDVDGVRGVVMRQPTRKEETLRPVWARMGYSVDVGGVSGPVIFLEAQTVPLMVRWGKRLAPEDQRELDRLLEAADSVEQTRRGHNLHFGIEGIRRVQLYHSLPHEIGHWADLFEMVEYPGLEDFDQWKQLWERYFQRPVSEREEFAHRYAEEVTSDLRRSGTVPFDRHIDVEKLTAEGLHLEDFLVESKEPDAD